MKLYNTDKIINFIGGKRIALVVSLLLISASIWSLTTTGLNYSIDFTGGTKIELGYEISADIEKIRDSLSRADYEDVVVQNFGSTRDVLIRVPLSEGASSADVSTAIVQALRDASEQEINIRSVEFVGPQFGKELFEKGLLALLYALIGIMIYVAFRFEWKFSLGAVVALVHDVVITIGLFSIMQLEFSLPVLAAILAVIGYSLNDTIVVFDRIRENFRKLRDFGTVDTVNRSIQQTLPRTILTSLTTLLVLGALFFFGGEALQGFAVALIIGVFVGTYSSIFVASPTVLALGATAQDLIIEKVEKEGADQPDFPHLR